MGSPISVIVANLVMESIENKMLKDFASPPRIWLRYIDDTFVVVAGVPKLGYMYTQGYISTFQGVH